MSLSNQLKESRISKGLSQAYVAQTLNVSRQAISKWENNRGYPDIDNLISLSELYQVSIDELLHENKQLKEQISKNSKEITDKKKKIKYITQERNKDKDEGLFLLLLAGISSFIFPLGLILSSFAIWKNKKSNSFYKLVYLVCILALLLNLYDGYIHLANIMNWGEVSVEKIN